HPPVDESKNGVVASETNISAGKEFAATLAQNDVTRDHGLSSKLFHTETFACAVASILDASLSLFMSHKRELCGDGFDLQPRELTAMTDGAMIALAALVFEGNDLWRLCLLKDFDDDRGPRHQRRPNREAVAIRHQKDLFKFGLCARLEVELFNLD